MTDAKMREKLEGLVGDYNVLSGKKSYQYYAERRKKYLKDFCADGGKSKIVVDLAAGMSRYSDAISNYGLLLNMDISLNILKTNTLSGTGVSKVVSDALKIPLKDNSADSLLLLGLLHHVPYGMEEVFRETSRVLKNGGTVFIDEPNGYNPMWHIYMKLDKIDRIGARPVFPRGLKKLAKKSCLKVEKELYWGFIPPLSGGKFLMGIFRKIESVMENSFLACLCTRYVAVLRKEVHG